MARFNEILVGRYNRFLQKLLSMKGGPVAAQLGSEVNPIFPFFSGSENRYLEGWGRFKAFANVPAVAAQTSAVQLRMPVPANVVAVIEEIILFTTPQSQIDLSVTHAPTITPALTNVGVGATIDGRSLQNAALEFSSGNNFADLPITLQSRVPQNNIELALILFEDQEWNVLPGDCYRFVCSNVNQVLRLNMTWRERFLEDSERF